MRSRVRMFGLAGLLSLAAGAWLPAGCGTVDKETLALLPPDKAMQLRTWSTNHSIVFDLRIHSMETCPFLTYLPNTSLKGQEWAEFAWKFYGAKHAEQDNCTCDVDMTRPDPVPPGNPDK